MPLDQIFPAYFLACMDRHGIKITDGFEHDSYCTEWVK